MYFKPMRNFAAFCVSGVILLIMNPPPEKDGKEMDLKTLSGVNKPSKFKVVPYLNAATELQKMGKEKACDKLLGLAKKGDEGQIAILCRVLISKRAGSPFRPPRFGGPICLGGTNPEDWPSLPLEMVDGVPFLIVHGYNIGGVPEPSLNYLNYCFQNCEWSATKLNPVTPEALEKALKKLLGSGKWKKPLTDYEKEFLSSQIK